MIIFIFFNFMKSTVNVYLNILCNLKKTKKLLKKTIHELKKVKNTIGKIKTKRINLIFFNFMKSTVIYT